MRVSLFWRTYLLLATLLMGSVLGWMQLQWLLTIEPQALQSARLTASLVHIARTALRHTDSQQAQALVRTLRDEEGLILVPRERGDLIELPHPNAYDQRVSAELRQRLGPETEVASSLNGAPGLWVSLSVGGERYWMNADAARLHPVAGDAWWWWMLLAALLSAIGAAVIARLINRPLKQLSFAASRLRDGDFEASHLSEDDVTSEIREVNAGFNRMARQLAKIDQDRAVMLAGISHDLRTPLARMRLESELSIADPQARAHMAADIDQLDAIIDKFLEYARPDKGEPVLVELHEIVASCTYAVQPDPHLTVRTQVPEGLTVLGDPVELARVLGNLIENARHYGKSVDTGITLLDISAFRHPRDLRVLLRVRDHGLGVNPEVLPGLTRPFYRGDAARTAASGAGLGLAIVEKSIERMGGELKLSNAPDGGFQAEIQLPSPPSGK